MGMFDSYREGGIADNLFAFAPPLREIGMTAGSASLQALKVPFKGFLSARIDYRQAHRLLLSVAPERVGAAEDGNGTFLSWTLSAEETSLFGGTLLDTYAQATVLYEDGTELASEPIRVSVNEPLAYLGKEDSEDGQ